MGSRGEVPWQDHKGGSPYRSLSGIEEERSDKFDSKNSDTKKRTSQAEVLFRVFKQSGRAKAFAAEYGTESVAFGCCSVLDFLGNMGTIRAAALMILPEDFLLLARRSSVSPVLKSHRDFIHFRASSDKSEPRPLHRFARFKASPRD